MKMDANVTTAVVLVIISTLATAIGPQLGLTPEGIAAINMGANSLAVMLGVRAPNAETRALRDAQKGGEP